MPTYTPTLCPNNDEGTPSPAGQAIRSFFSVRTAPDGSVSFIQSQTGPAIGRPQPFMTTWPADDPMHGDIFDVTDPSFPEDIDALLGANDANRYDALTELAELLGTQNTAAPEETINSLPTQSFDKDKGPEDNRNCVICIGEFEDGDELKTMPCGHLFHSRCIDRWLRIKKTCPTCKYELT